MALPPSNPPKVDESGDTGTTGGDPMDKGDDDGKATGLSTPSGSKTPEGSCMCNAAGIKQAKEDFITCDCSKQDYTSCMGESACEWKSKDGTVKNGTMDDFHGGWDASVSKDTKCKCNARGLAAAKKDFITCDCSSYTPRSCVADPGCDWKGGTLSPTMSPADGSGSGSGSGSAGPATPLMGKCVSDKTFKDSYGDCATYAAKKWCTKTGKAGPAWQADWGGLDPRVVNACCECGKDSPADIDTPSGGGGVPTVSGPGTCKCNAAGLKQAKEDFVACDCKDIKDGNACTQDPSCDWAKASSS